LPFSALIICFLICQQWFIKPTGAEQARFSEEATFCHVAAILATLMCTKTSGGDAELI
jgi:hypothetical protein